MPGFAEWLKAHQNVVVPGLVGVGGIATILYFQKQKAATRPTGTALSSILGGGIAVGTSPNLTLPPLITRHPGPLPRPGLPPGPDPGPRGLGDCPPGMHRVGNHCEADNGHPGPLPRGSGTETGLGRLFDNGSTKAASNGGSIEEHKPYVAALVRAERTMTLGG